MQYRHDVDQWPHLVRYHLEKEGIVCGHFPMYQYISSRWCLGSLILSVYVGLLHWFGC